MVVCVFVSMDPAQTDFILLTYIQKNWKKYLSKSKDLFVICRVDEKLRVKITDNALSRDLFPTDYYCLGDNENRPIKWLALESLQQKQFTAASDVVIESIYSIILYLWKFNIPFKAYFFTFFKYEYFLV